MPWWVKNWNIFRSLFAEGYKRGWKVTVKHGGGSSQVWGCIFTNSFRDLVKINGVLNAEKYRLILSIMPQGSIWLAPNLSCSRIMTPNIQPSSLRTIFSIEKKEVMEVESTAEFLQVRCVCKCTQKNWCCLESKGWLRHILIFLHSFSVCFTGSTDVVSCSVHGVRDPATAAMHIVLGKPPPTPTHIYYTVDMSPCVDFTCFSFAFFVVFFLVVLFLSSSEEGSTNQPTNKRPEKKTIYLTWTRGGGQNNKEKTYICAYLHIMYIHKNIIITTIIVIKINLLPVISYNSYLNIVDLSVIAPECPSAAGVCKILISLANNYSDLQQQQMCGNKLAKGSIHNGRSWQMLNSRILFSLNHRFLLLSALPHNSSGLLLGIYDDQSACSMAGCCVRMICCGEMLFH